MEIYKIIEEEIRSYMEDPVEISDGHHYLQSKLIKRIHVYANKVYPGGKVDSQGNYKYWFDVQDPRIDSEVKNIDFDTKDILLYSENQKDNVAVIIANLAIDQWMKETKVYSKINDAVEEGSGWGNVIWKKIKGGFEKLDPLNTYVINTTAKTLEDSPVIERHVLTQSQMRAKSESWDQAKMEEAITSGGNKSFSSQKDTNKKETQIPYYEIFERNGEISIHDLKEAQGKSGSEADKKKYVYAKVVVCGLEKSEGGGSADTTYVLYAKELKSGIPYKEYHRGRYKGRWWREGLYEILFDIQTRANEIGNQIAQGLEYSSKIVLKSSENLLVENIMTDIMNGDIVKSKDLSQVKLEIPGMAQLVTDWNNLMILADKLANSYEVVQGETSSNVPFRSTALLNINANKLFNFLREKLAGALEEVFEEWICPQLLEDIKAKDILTLTGDPEYLKKYYEILTNTWYLQNLVAIGPHNPEIAEALKAEKMEQLQTRKKVLIRINKKLWRGLKVRTKIVISGENVNIASDLETLATFIKMEVDPVRRQALIEKAMAMKGIDVSSLPKSNPEALQKGGPAELPKEPGKLDKILDTAKK